MASAEKLPEWLATAFEEKFGIRPMEGYGCTECSPLVTCSTRDFRAAGFRQAGSRRSSIGRPLPGVPDSKKGEKLVVLHTLPEQRLPELLKKLQQLGLPNLWTPRPNQFFHVATLPLLATGKRDLRSVRELAARLSTEMKSEE